MRIDEALNLNNTDTYEELYDKVKALKTKYANKKRTLSKRFGGYNSAINLTNDKIDRKGLNKRVNNMTRNELYKVGTLYKDFFGFESSSIKGYKKILLETEKNTGFVGYSDISESDRKRYWEIVDKVRELGPEYFMQKGITPEFLYQSGTNFKLLSFYIKNEKEYDPVKLIEKLEKSIENYNEDGETLSSETTGL